MGSRPELLNYPQIARMSRTRGRVTARITVGNDGRVKTLHLESEARMLIGVVQEFFEQAIFPVGCEGKSLGFSFEFALLDNTVSEPRRTVIEILPPNVYRIVSNTPFFVD